MPNERVDIFYVDGEPDRLFGSHDVASQLAEEAGLTLAPLSDGSVRWVRDGDAWPSEQPHQTMSPVKT
jgi:hypothetical protein